MSPRVQSPLTIEFVLLGLLESRTMHGYELHKELNRLEGVGLVWRLKQSRLYALLERMESEGLVVGKMATVDNRPARREYTLTPEGCKRFEAWRQSPVDHMRDVRQEFLARLYFALQAGREPARQLLAAQRKATEEWSGGLEDCLAAVEDEQVYEKMVYSYRATQAGALLEWLDTCKKMVLS